ncbi:MAG: phosphate acyltransferase, partial [Thiomonas sp. 20-64-9]
MRACEGAFDAGARCVMSSTLAVDLMGGDHGPKVTLPACVQFLQAHPDSRLILVGQAEAVMPLLESLRLKNDARIEFVAASEVVTSDDPVEV